MRKKILGILFIVVLVSGCAQKLSKEDYVKQVNTITNDMIVIYSDLPSAIYFSTGDEQKEFINQLNQVISLKGPDEFYAKEKEMDDKLSEVVKLLNESNSIEDEIKKTSVLIKAWDTGYDVNKLAQEYDSGLFKKQ